MARARPETEVEEHLRETDGLPNKRDALPPGALPGVPPDPQGDENRTPPIPAGQTREHTSGSTEERRSDR